MRSFLKDKIFKIYNSGHGYLVVNVGYCWFGVHLSTGVLVHLPVWYTCLTKGVVGFHPSYTYAPVHLSSI